MRYSYYCLILSLLPLLLTAACGRTDMMRIRLMAGATEKKQDLALLTNKQSTSSAKETVTDPKTSGNSIYLMLGSIGFGSTALVTSFEKETRSKTNDSLLLKETTKINARFNDLAFVIGEDYTFMWGFGAFAGGSLQTKVEYGYTGAIDETLDSNFITGQSTFIILGHHGSGFETLVGMRSNDIKAELKTTGTSAKTLHEANTIKMEDTGIHFKTSQLFLGIGITF